MIDDKIKTLASKGYGNGAIARLLDIKPDDVVSVLGVDDTDNTQTYELPEYSESALREKAEIELFRLLHNIECNPQAYKPGEALAIIREALDRTRGRSAQTLTVEAKATVTHSHVMSLDPVDAYRLLIEGKASVSGLPVIDVTPEAGGDTVDMAAGVYVGEDATQNTRHFLEKG